MSNQVEKVESQSYANGILLALLLMSGSLNIFSFGVEMFKETKLAHEVAIAFMRANSTGTELRFVEETLQRNFQIESFIWFAVLAFFGLATIFFLIATIVLCWAEIDRWQHSKKLAQLA